MRSQQPPIAMGSEKHDHEPPFSSVCQKVIVDSLKTRLRPEQVKRFHITYGESDIIGLENVPKERSKNGAVGKILLLIPRGDKVCNGTRLHFHKG